MIIWLNGTFGAGKSTTARGLVPLVPGSRLFDPELVGYVLMEYLSDHEFSDFQDLAPWRTLVPIVTNQVAQFTGQHLIATQSVLNEAYWAELRQGFFRYSLDVFHVVLHVESGVARRSRRPPGAAPRSASTRLPDTGSTPRRGDGWPAAAQPCWPGSR